MEQERNPERHEVYERIPWETLDTKNGDRQWIMFAVTGAVVLGVLAYSFMANRPQPVATAPVGASTIAAAAPVPTAAPVVPPPPAPTSPVVISEADLYAVDPERLVDQAVAHAEWFVAEYFTADGSEEHRTTLRSLMPAGVPLPSAPEGTRVFVESAGGVGVTETGPLRYEVEVLVRYLVSGPDEVYRREPPALATVEVEVGDDGPRVVLPPRIAAAAAPMAAQPALGEVPPPVAEAAGALIPVNEIVGGVQRADGGWQVVAISTGPDGVSRPVTVVVTP